MDYKELLLRFLLLLISLLLFIFVANRKKSDNINPMFCIVSVCTFMLCVLFTKIEIGLGIGFGLFAIFSILRFRTQTFSLTTIIFLFASITISILDCLFPIEKINILLELQIFLVLIFIFCFHFNTDKSQKFNTIFEIVLMIDDGFEVENLRKLIADHLKETNFEFHVICINYKSKQAEIKVFL